MKRDRPFPNRSESAPRNQKRGSGGGGNGYDSDRLGKLFKGVHRAAVIGPKTHYSKKVDGKVIVKSIIRKPRIKVQICNPHHLASGAMGLTLIMISNLMAPT